MWSGSGPRGDQKRHKKATTSQRLPAAKSTGPVLSSLVPRQVSVRVASALRRSRELWHDFALFMVETLENDELIYDAPAIVGCQTPLALTNAAT
jgi:hypothetical protein